MHPILKYCKTTVPELQLVDLFKTLNPHDTTINGSSEEQSNYHDRLVDRLYKTEQRTNYVDSANFVEGSEALMITQRDLYLLQNNDNMITDNVINGFSILLENGVNTSKKFKIFSNKFYHKLNDGGYCYENVRRYEKQLDVFELDVLLLPLFVKKCHWTLVAVYPKRRCMYYLDSMNGDGRQHLMNILKWLFERHLKIYGEPLNLESWKLFDRAIGFHQQVDSVDCGVFCTMYMDCLCRDICVNSINQDSNIVRVWRSYLKYCLATRCIF